MVSSPSWTLSFEVSVLRTEVEHEVWVEDEALVEREVRVDHVMQLKTQDHKTKIAIGAVVVADEVDQDVAVPVVVDDKKNLQEW